MDLLADDASLAVLGREWLLHGHLQDRVGMALVMERASREEMQEVAIEEWMAASPIYSRRMQHALNFAGDGVDTIVKNLQLDIGAPHEFMDFRYRLTDREHGEFWLAHCGALMDVEPMGEDFVRGMCHAIEDPTFDATAGATNPLAQVRPIHRPPRIPADRTPHCRWRIDIASGDERVEPHPNQALVAASKLATLPVITPQPAEVSAGLPDYSGPFAPDFCLEDLALPALEVAVREFAVQSHLLLRSFLLAVTQRFGAEFAAEILPRLVAGWGGLTAQRLRDAFDLPPDAQGLVTMLRLHPLLNPSTYVAVGVEATDARSVRLSLRDCPAVQEDDALTWLTGPGESIERAFRGLVQAFSPRMRIEAAGRHADEILAFDARVDPSTGPVDDSAELMIAKISTGAAFRFRRPSGRVLRLPSGVV